MSLSKMVYFLIGVFISASAESVRAAVPDFEPLQFHLGAPPAGVNAVYAWAQNGGTGKGIRVFDLESGWFTQHVEFRPPIYDNKKNLVKQHGTAVWGLVAAQRDGEGTTGIAFDADFGIMSHGFNSDNYVTFSKILPAIVAEEISHLRSGDVFLIELQIQATPKRIYAPIEYLPGVYSELQKATARGIHCVEVAGNGAYDLDDDIFEGTFNLKNRDSGCILVAAVNSPLSEMPHQLSTTSNYGSRIDVHGYGTDVVTTGYGDLYNSSDKNILANYTKSFDGTSSAGAIVAGAVASTLGILKAQGKLVTPYELREALRKTGTPANGSTQRHVGNLPDIRQVVEYLQ